MRAIPLHSFLGAWSGHTTPPQGPEQFSSRTQHAQVIENEEVVLSFNSLEFARALSLLAYGAQHCSDLFRKSPEVSPELRSLASRSDMGEEHTRRGQELGLLC